MSLAFLLKSHLILLLRGERCDMVYVGTEEVYQEGLAPNTVVIVLRY